MIEPTIHVGDCLEIMRGFPSESVDLVIGDPPYNLGKDYGNSSDFLHRNEYLDFTRKWLNEIDRVLKPHGSLYIFMGVRHISRLFVLLEDEFAFQFNGWIVWHYTQGMGRTKGFSARHDDILYFSKSKTCTFNLDSVRIPQKYYRARNNMRGANPGDVWEFSHVHYCQESRTGHPTQKPEGLIERIVLASSNANDCVLDPFAGSGTTLRVCQQLNRAAIGIELNPDYVTIIKKRLAEPFRGFDSVDPRMKRIPNDLNDAGSREEYRRKHKAWFLAHRPEDQREFDTEFRRKYAGKEQQRSLFIEDDTDNAAE